MATNVLMPKWGMSMREGVVCSWLKHEGDAVQQGDQIVEVESEKATNFVEAPATGVLARILVPAGETVAVSKAIAIIAADGEDISDCLPEEGETAPEPQAQPAVAKAPKTQPRALDALPRRPPHAARRLAREHNVDLSGVKGTGPEGMIVVEDVEAAMTATSGNSTAPVSPVVFYSDGYELDGIFYLPTDLAAGQVVPGIVFCLGYTYVKDLLVPEMARRLSTLGKTEVQNAYQ